ncbi:MAG TPA: class I SAM-dependent methyltransferase [Bacteroidota bacterium]|nr:class I SAM-dependent methyltransferase [Bacteroidota bacterium]
MSDRRMSRTAFGTAYMRAAHLLLDAPPHVLDDAVVIRLLGPEAIEKITADTDMYQTPERRALRAHVVLRTRFAEDRLAMAVQRGVSYYVILGAGLDTFAYRQPAWANKVEIVEVDHPGTQNVKKELLRRAGIPVPRNLAFAPVDFEHETLGDGLLRHGVSAERKAFFSWLGVTMYLEERAIDSVLRTIAGYPVGSEVVLTFARSDGPPSPFESRAAEMGEKWISFFTPETMEARLRATGFSGIQFLQAKEAEQKYFRDSTSRLYLSSRTTIVAAQV